MNYLKQLFSFSRSRKRRDWKMVNISDFPSEILNAPYKIQLFLPPDYENLHYALPILFFNDGQDMKAVKLKERLQELYHKNKINPLLVVAIHAVDRMQTYGSSQIIDYKRRGSKAKRYGQFITEELLPWLRLQYKVRGDHQAHSFAGFSLGGLSALDIVWNYPAIFGQVGVFSGALWWRSRPFNPNDPDGHRIMHEVMAKGPQKEGLRFWFQTGTEDEQEDRNNNGVIDAIDDTLDLIDVLKNRGYSDIKYVEMEGGKHDLATWGRVLPEFLRWGFGGE